MAGTTRSRRKSGGADDKPAPGSEIETERGTRYTKQAVVVVHGMGEQRPLETLRSFVETVYQRDLSLTRDDDRQRVDDPVLGRINRVWIAPDAATGSIELRRISTPANRSKVRTDFFELYWADIMQGTPVELVVSWIRGLLLRSPFRVPRRLPVWIAWILLWVLAIAFVAFSFAVMEPTTGPFSRAVESIVAFLSLVRLPLAILLAAGGLSLLIFRVMTTKPISEIRLALPLVMLVVAGGLYWFLDAIGHPKLWAAAFSAGIAALMASILVPYVGDVARYVRATPATVAKREAIRERGLKLLRDLHNEKDWQGRYVYDRIVLVAHSLGSIVSYDLLVHLWEELGPNHKREKLPSKEVVAALGEVDKYVADVWCRPDGAEPEPFPLEKYREAQKALFDALVASDQGWRISDFVTVGSPLVHAEFLLADSREEMERDFKERFLCTAPPRPDEPGTSMLYGKGNRFAHFAAPFAAVRWTNIYDEHWFPLCGDIVSGPVATRARFGPGIREHRVAIRRPGLLRRFVTHTLYWTWQKGYDPDSPPDHIKHLRDALGL
jgi:hypothetical protein